MASCRLPASSKRCARTAISLCVSAGRPLPDNSSTVTNPAAGPCTIASATARLWVTTGLPVPRSRILYRIRICGQSVGFTAEFDVVNRRSCGGCVAFVEHQVEHRQHRLEAVLGACRRQERRAGFADAGLGAGDALRHGRLGKQVRVSDLRRRKSGDGAERQRDLCGRRQRRMTAQLHDLLAVVRGRCGPVRERMGEGGVCQLTVPPPLLATDPVDEPASGGGDQPRAGIIRPPLHRPLFVGREQCLLNAVFAQVELVGAVAAQERAEGLRREGTQQVLGCGGTAHMFAPAENITGRISSARPLMPASGISCASSIARSFDSTSIR